MEIIGLILFTVGIIISLFYGIRLIIIAFQNSVLWGLLFLFLPFANLYFIVTNWERCKSPFLKGLLAIPFIIIGVMLMPSGIAP